MSYKFRILLIAGLFAAIYFIGSGWLSSSKETAGKTNELPNKNAQSDFNNLTNNSLDEKKEKPAQNNDSTKTISKAELVNKLSLSSDVNDAFEAFMLVNRCIQAEEFFKSISLEPVDVKNKNLAKEFDDGKKAVVSNCEDITEQHKRGRFENLKKAQDGNVRGAALEFMNSGPFGDMSALTSRPDDSLVVAWKKQVIYQLEKEAKLGNSAMFVYLMNIYEENVLTSQNLELAATYGVARLEALNFEGKKNTATSNYLKVLQKNMSEERKKEIEIAGKRLAATCCSK